MTSKEALEDIKKSMGLCNVGSKYYLMDFPKEIETIKKDLEVLEILKKHLFLTEPYDIKYIESDLTNYTNKEDFIKVKEWLNDK